MVDDIFDTRFENAKVELSENRAQLGDDINLMEKDPALKNVLVGVGWDLKAFDADALDLDVSLFMLNKNGETRVDEDFVFYNHVETLSGGVKHNGDSRTGAGDGDDESISIDLHAVPFDIVKLRFVISVYKGFEKQQNLGMVRGAYLRLVNTDTEHEIIRYALEDDLKDRTEQAVIVADINREGPKWHFAPVADFVDGGLSEIARLYGLIINQE